MKTKYRQCRVAREIIGLMVLGSLSAPAALSAAPAAAETSSLEEVVVTAQRREERLQDVPISITALSGELIQTRGVTNVQHLDEYVPNLKLGDQTSYNTLITIAIRGSVELNPALYFDPAVGIYLDGVYVSKAQGAVFDRPDLERVEVLRGPQGTLYGRNTFAGAINLISAKPTGQLGGDVKIGAGNYDSQLARFNLNLPQFGDFKVKFSGLYNKHDGYQTVRQNPYPNVAQAQPRPYGRVDSEDNKAGRMAVRYQPADALTLDYTYDYNRAEDIPVGGQLINVAKLPLTGALFDPASPAYAGALIGGVYRGFPGNLYLMPNYSSSVYVGGSVNDQPPNERLRVNAHALTAAWQLGDLTLKSITGARWQHFSNHFDLDATPLPLASAELVSLLKTVSQEFQAVGTIGAWNYAGGIYYYRERAGYAQKQQFFGNATTSASDVDFGTNSYAAYGQVDYHLTDAITLTGGVRYSSDHKFMDAALHSINVAKDLTSVIFPRTSNTTDAHAITPTAIFKYTFSPDANVYAKYARGFKAGGFSLGTVAAFALVPYKPEFDDSFEIGTKLRFFNDTLQLNVAAYHNKVSDLQVSVFTSNGTLTTSTVQNAASATIQGGEVELEWAAADWLRLRTSLGYTDPKYNSYLNAGVNIADTRVFVIAPKITASAGVDAQLWRSDVTNVHLMIDYSHSDPYFTLNFDRRPLSNAVRSSAIPTEAQSIDLVDATLLFADIAWGSGTLEFSLWSRNLTNTHRATGGVDFGATFGNLTEGFFNPPRTFGAEAGYKF